MNKPKQVFDLLFVADGRKPPADWLEQERS